MKQAEMAIGKQDYPCRICMVDRNNNISMAREILDLSGVREDRAGYAVRKKDDRKATADLCRSCVRNRMRIHRSSHNRQPRGTILISHLFTGFCIFITLDCSGKIISWFLTVRPRCRMPHVDHQLSMS